MARSAKTAAARDDRPLLNANFVVELAAGKGSGFAEVVFGPFTVSAASGADAVQPSPAAGAGALANRVVLRRGATGALDLYEWWRQARDGRAPRRRTVTVKLLAEDRSTVLVSWRLRNARPVSLAYSPLDALQGAVLMETIELAFDDVEMTATA
jgi:phage tail-like protein